MKKLLKFKRKLKHTKKIQLYQTARRRLNEYGTLAPAGSRQALTAAVQSGADAVYLGGPQFGARYSAENFTIEEMKTWVDYCHLYGVDVHVTVNTLVKEKEIESLKEYLKQLNEIGVDALIVQDMGAVEIIKRLFRI